jgi:hypothetical protein
MNELAGDLLAAFLPGLTRPERTGSEREHNLRWAERRLRGKRGRRDPQKLSASEVWHHLFARLPTCRYCRTPIMAGCRLDGQLVTRRRRFCDDACKMRKVRTLTSSRVCAPEKRIDFSFRQPALPEDGACGFFADRCGFRKEAARVNEMREVHHEITVPRLW